MGATEEKDLDPTVDRVSAPAHRGAEESCPRVGGRTGDS